jgi:hypothetical protein
MRAGQQPSRHSEIRVVGPDDRGEADGRAATLGDHWTIVGGAQ